jgi:hypothetical protein
MAQKGLFPNDDDDNDNDDDVLKYCAHTVCSLVRKECSRSSYVGIRTRYYDLGRRALIPGK